MSPSWEVERKRLEHIHTHIDEEITILLDSSECRYILKVDASVYHRIGPKFHCTDAFLQSFLSAILQPTVTGTSTLLQKLSDATGLAAHMLPVSSGNTVLTILEAVLESPVVVKAIEAMRASACKKVLAIDAQFKTMMNVLYQIPHGASIRRKNIKVQPGGIHCTHTVRAADTLLLSKAQPSEGLPAQLDSLNEAVGINGNEEVELIFSDAPSVLDVPATFALFLCLLAIAKDPIHVALKVEKSSGGTVTQLSLRLRILMRKFSVGYDDGKPYHTKQSDPPRVAHLTEVAEAMTVKEAKHRALTIDSKGYATKPFKKEVDFVKDVVALTILHKKEMKKSTGKKSSVFGSLNFATKNSQLQYLFNGPRYIARNPTVKVPYGTVECEAVHAEQKKFFEKVKQQSARRAKAFVTLFSLRKMLIGNMQRLSLTKTYAPVEFLRICSQRVGAMSPFWKNGRLTKKTKATFISRLNLTMVPRNQLDKSCVPKGATLSCVHKGKKRKALV